MSTLFLIIGGLIMLVGGIWLLVEAFKESVLWGIGSILVPLVSLIFVITHWDVSKKPFLIQIGGVVLFIIGVAMAPNPVTQA